MMDHPEDAERILKHLASTKLARRVDAEFLIPIPPALQMYRSRKIRCVACRRRFYRLAERGPLLLCEPCDKKVVDHFRMEVYPFVVGLYRAANKVDES